MLAGVDGDCIGIDQENEADTTLIPFAWIVEAKLYLSDKLLKYGAEIRAQRLAAGIDGGEPDIDTEEEPA